MKYNRVLLKFSGEAFGQKNKGLDLTAVKQIVAEIFLLRKSGVKVAVVVGGGNHARGREVVAGKRINTDVLGMQATLKNIEPLFNELKKLKLKAKISTSFSLKSKYPVFNQQVDRKAYDNGTILLLAGGTGYPFFSTDMASVLRSLQLGAQIFIKATKVDGVFTADPKKVASAKKISRLNYKQIIANELKVIDLTAVSLAWENKLPIRVIKWEKGNIVKAVNGNNFGSLIN